VGVLGCYRCGLVVRQKPYTPFATAVRTAAVASAFGSLRGYAPR